MCSKFQLDWSMNTWVIVIFVKCVNWWKRKKPRNFMKIFWLISQERLEDLIQIWNRASPDSTVNLGIFGWDIMELWMRENCNFVVPVNILTYFTCTPFSWAAQHTTVYLDTGSWSCNRQGSCLAGFINVLLNWHMLCSRTSCYELWTSCY